MILKLKELPHNSQWRSCYTRREGRLWSG